MQLGSSLACWHSAVASAGAFDDRLENNFHGNGRRGVERGGDFLRVGGHFFQGVRPVQMLAAGDKPDFELFQVNHTGLLFLE